MGGGVTYEPTQDEIDRMFCKWLAYPLLSNQIVRGYLLWLHSTSVEAELLNW